jgi:hypothetical protein
LNIAFNILAGGQRIEHIELRRNDEVFLNALGAQRGCSRSIATSFISTLRLPTDRAQSQWTHRPT